MVGVGECGFDIHLKQETGNTKHETTKSEKEFQKELFEAQIRLAAELKFPLVVHCRNAWEETLQLLDSIAPNKKRSFAITQDDKNEGLQNDKGEGLRGVFHSWTGDWEAAKKALDLGFYISFSGIVTYKNAPDIADVAKKVPLDKMLLETDSPFLTPEPIRSGGPPSLKFRRMRQNEPKNVKMIAQFIASLRNIPLDKICSITSNNAERLFGI